MAATRKVKIQYYRDARGKVRFRFKSSNGKVIAGSQDGYDTPGMASKSLVKLIEKLRAGEFEIEFVE